MAPLRYAAKFDPFLSLDCVRVEGGRDQILRSGNLVQDPLAMFRRLTNLPNVSMTEGGRGGGGKMTRGRYAKEQNWGKSGGEGVENRFWIGGSMTKGKERRLILSFRRMKKSNYSNISANTSFPVSMVCKNSSDSLQDCSVTRVRVANETQCYCNVITNPDVTNEECCHQACCNEIVKMHSNATDLFIQDPTVKTDSSTQTESTTDMEHGDIPHSTTAGYSGSAPARGQLDLAAFATAILILIHRRAQANWL